MNLSLKSSLMRNIAKFRLDSRIRKTALTLKGTASVRMGARVSQKPGYSSVVMDFRHYIKGDAIKDIDWKLSARTEKLFVKIREGYRQTDILILVDDSESMKTVYQPNEPSKFTTALTLAYIAGSMALKSKDRLFVQWGEERVRIQSAYALLETLLAMERGDVFGNAKGHLPTDFWQRRMDPGTYNFVFSDFFVAQDIGQHFFKQLANTHHHFFIYRIQDPFEETFHLKGNFRLMDPESSASIRTRPEDIKERYRQLYAEHAKAAERMGKRFAMASGPVRTSEDPYHAFVKVASWK